jgi:NAD(P)H-hydrate epimerase
VGALADWLTPLPDSEVMRGIDRWAIEERGASGLDLMERAGAGVASALERLVPDGPVTVVCGKGNNGGDGLVAARLLREAGRDVRVLSVAPPDDFSGDARANLDRLPGAGVELLAGGDLTIGAAGIIDALLGTGFEGQPRGAVAEAIQAVNGAGAPVVSVDVPSGVDASSGEVRGVAVHASVTATFHAGKPGLWIRPGKGHAGAVEVIDIGIPRGAPDGGAQIGLISTSVLERLPRRDASSTKFTSGHVLVAGGSRDLSGAPQMSAHASMRAGAGYVTACVPAALQRVLQGLGPPEMMTRGLPEQEGGIAAQALEMVLAETGQGGALALGPGLGRSDEASTFARELARRAQGPLVLDADGLNAHAGRLSDLAGRNAPTVLTPHAGELGRLLARDSAAIEEERLHHVRVAAELAGAIVVLKGDDTLVAAPDGRVAVSPGASPALATAGSGDVLTGVIAALLSQGLDAFTAAAAAVSLHARAGRLAAAHQGSAEGVIASDLIAMLPAARGGPPGEGDPQ